MSLARRAGMTAREFLVWCESRPNDPRHELVAGEPVAMSPERNRHSLVKLDCALSLRLAVRRAGVSCVVFGDGVSVIVNDDTVYAPDVTVQCGGTIDPDAVTVETPIILVEVLSPSTRGVDTGRKLTGYFRIESVAHYLVVDPELQVVTHHGRADGTIGTTILREGRLRLAPPGIEVEVHDLFASLSA